MVSPEANPDGPQSRSVGYKQVAESRIFSSRHSVVFWNGLLIVTSPLDLHTRGLQ